MPAKKTRIKIVEGSCNTCKYRVSVPKDPTSRDLDAVRKHFTLIQIFISNTKKNLTVKNRK